MSITLIHTPQNLEPVFSVNGIPFILSSTLSSTYNFKYVFELNVQNPAIGYPGGTYTKVHRSLPRPNPDTYGYYSPAEILKNYISYELYPYTLIPTGITAATRFYQVNIGENFSTNQNFYNATNSGGYVLLSFTTLSGVTAGDEIQIVMDSGSENPQYTGVWTATTVGATTILTNCLFGTTPTSGFDPGSLKSILHLQSTLTGYTAINATKQYFDFNQDWQARWHMSGTTSQWLTNYNYTSKPIRIGKDEVATLSFLQDGTAISHYRVLTYSGATNVGDFLVTINSAFSQRKDIPTGTWNYRQITATNDITAASENIIVDGIDRYTVQLYNGAIPVSKLVNYEIECTPSRFSTLRFCFVNKCGGIDYISFQMKSIFSSTIKREMIDKTLHVLFNVGDRGETTTNIQSDDFITVNTNWLNDNEVTYIKELFKSHQIYLLSDAQQVMYPVTVADNQYTQKTILNNNLIQYKIKFKYAYPNINQSN